MGRHFTIIGCVCFKLTIIYWKLYLTVLLAVSPDDTFDTIKWMCNKIVNLRIFPDDENKMNRSVLDIGGEILIISNFTLYGDVKKGFRPNYMASAPQETASKIYSETVNYLRKNYPIKVEDGLFGAMMEIELTNDGPVTIIIDK